MVRASIGDRAVHLPVLAVSINAHLMFDSCFAWKAASGLESQWRVGVSQCQSECLLRHIGQGQARCSFTPQISGVGACSNMAGRGSPGTTCIQLTRPEKYRFFARAACVSYAYIVNGAACECNAACP